MLKGLTKNSSLTERRGLRRVELKKALKLINYYDIQIKRSNGKTLYLINDKRRDHYYFSLDEVLNEVIPQPSQSDINKELQQKVDSLEKQVVDLNQKLRQRAII